jgi:hypothetical protein
MKSTAASLLLLVSQTLSFTPSFVPNHSLRVSAATTALSMSASNERTYIMVSVIMGSIRAKKNLLYALLGSFLFVLQFSLPFR